MENFGFRTFRGFLKLCAVTSHEKIGVYYLDCERAFVAHTAFSAQLVCANFPGAMLLSLPPFQDPVRT